MRYYYGPLTTIEDLPVGSLFETNDGTKAVKSEYYQGDMPLTILLDSGEYGGFINGKAKTPCRQIFFDDELSESE